LTVLGYSVMDTIIVFDRIRENTALMKKETYSDMVDRSIRQIVARSINTSLLTLIPITCLLLFGGATLKDFAFALFIGIISGTYSSIFVASPIVVLWKEREPRYKKRLAMERVSNAG
jgi:preprotein translocase SecF subunit